MIHCPIAQLLAQLGNCSISPMYQVSLAPSLFGEKIKLTESLVHFFKSPLWLDFKSTFWSLYRDGESKQWKNFYDDVVQSFDPTGEKNARNVLGISETATEEEVRRRYKKLVVYWHPDRYKGTDKEEAQQQFIEIQQAYELLQKRFKRKTTRNIILFIDNDS